jgi:hypothetical protein
MYCTTIKYGYVKEKKKQVVEGDEEDKLLKKI